MHTTRQWFFSIIASSMLMLIVGGILYSVGCQDMDSPTCGYSDKICSVNTYNIVNTTCKYDSLDYPCSILYIGCANICNESYYGSYYDKYFNYNAAYNDYIKMLENPVNVYYKNNTCIFKDLNNEINLNMVGRTFMFIAGLCIVLTFLVILSLYIITYCNEKHIVTLNENDNIEHIENEMSNMINMIGTNNTTSNTQQNHMLNFLNLHNPSNNMQDILNTHPNINRSAADIINTYHEINTNGDINRHNLERIILNRILNTQIVLKDCYICKQKIEKTIKLYADASIHCAFCLTDKKDTCVYSPCGHTICSECHTDNTIYNATNSLHAVLGEIAETDQTTYQIIQQIATNTMI